MNIAGVPEHFNFPFIILSEKRPEHFQFISCPGGSGEMASLLLQSRMQEQQQSQETSSNEKVDVAVMLPEAAHTFIEANPEFKIFGEYTNSSIIWGAYTSKESSLEKWEDVRGKTFGISRIGSGSELMANYAYHQNKWPIDELKVKVVQNLQGARQAFENGIIDVFLWEILTTKSLVESGEWKKIGEVKGDWPGFVFVAHQETFFKFQVSFLSFYAEIKWCINEFVDNAEDWAPLAAKRFQLDNLKDPLELVEAIKKIEYSKDGRVHPEKYKSLQKVLKILGKIGQNGSGENPFH